MRQTTSLIDNIDKGWPTHGIKEEDLMLVRTLLESARKLEGSVEDAEIECKAVVFLRNDVYELLVQYTPDRGKLTKALVDWTDSDALKQLLKRRLIFSGLSAESSFEEMWSHICVPGVRGQDSIEFILERCLMRPRALLNAIAYIRGTAVNRGHRIIQAEDVLVGMRTHSHDLVEEISLEIRDVAPEMEDAVYLLLDAPARISRDDLLYLFISAGVDDVHWNKLIDLFLWYGVLGICRPGAGDMYIYSVSYNFAMLQATARKAGEGLVFVVNPAFGLALGGEEVATG